MKSKHSFGAVLLASAALAVPSWAQNESNANTQSSTQPAEAAVPADQNLNLRLAQTLDGAGNTANRTLGTAGSTLNNTLGTTGNTLNNTLGTVGNTATGVVGGLNPTLQPIGQGVGGALNNLTQPQTVQSLLEFLSSVIHNHIEAHVNLDSLRVEKLTVDIRGVDLRNLRVDLLVANSRNAGQVRPALNTAGTASPSSVAPQNSAAPVNNANNAAR